MGKKKKRKAEKRYKKTLRELQIELVKLQSYLIKNDLRILVIMEGRDGAGKDGTIKRLVEHLSPRETRVVALGKPSDREKKSWYFQRYAAQLPSDQEMVVMNRSWYNRAGVEHVMGFCTDDDYDHFMDSVIPFEKMLVREGCQLIKYYLDISKEEQKQRLHDRKLDPLKRWKTSPVDEQAIALWDEYSEARNDMFRRTHHDDAPWYVVQANKKKSTRLNVIRHLLATVTWPGKRLHTPQVNENVVAMFSETLLVNGFIAK